MVAGQDSKPPGVDRNRFVQTKLSREVGDGSRTQCPGVNRAPGPIGVQVFEMSSVCVVDPAVENVFLDAVFEVVKRNPVEQLDRVVIELTPSWRIEIQEKRCRLGIPAPPQISRERPETFLDRRHEAIQHTPVSY